MLLAQTQESVQCVCVFTVRRRIKYDKHCEDISDAAKDKAKGSKQVTAR